MNENLNALRERAYKNACEHGFHDKELSDEHWFCLIISELMEAVEADRNGKRADKEYFQKMICFSECNEIKWCKCFEVLIKDSVEDELSDAVIRLLDFAGLRNVDIAGFTKDEMYEAEEACNGELFTESIYAISTIPMRYYYEYGVSVDCQIRNMVLGVFGLAKHLGIDLLWHVETKMKYNEMRPMLHGKKY